MNLDNFKKEMLPLAGQMVLLYRDTIVRLVGVGEDDCDLYYIVKEKRNKQYWATAVGHIDPLKGVLSDEIYNQMDNLFHMDGCERTDTFEVAPWDGIETYTVEDDL